MSFVVTLKPSGRTFDVESGASILTTALKRHINLPYGCRLGTCRSCCGKVVEGSVDLGQAHPAYLPQSQRDEGYALLCQATALSDVTIEIEELPGLAQPIHSPAMVRRVERLAPDVALLVIRLPLHLNIRFNAGQYVDLMLPDGVRRSYSIANRPLLENMIDLEFHIRHMPGGLFTERLFAGMKVRERLEFQGPLGTFFLRESDKPAILLASGTGYAPLRSILLDELSRGSTRPFTLYWGGRSRKDLYLHEEVEALAREYPNLTYVPVLSEPTGDCAWAGRTGLVHHAVMEDHPDLCEMQVYACGAPVMVDAARNDFTTRCGLPAGDFHADSFITRADTIAQTNDEL